MATLYAQPTKEWVIPAKPKPGRKPKRDEPAGDDEGGSDFKAKKVQNRAAQRAFRERKQSQLADLQARLTQYEQGEIERNVALQNVAKKLKEENERLKSDNEKLQEEGGRVRQENMLMRTRLRELQEEFLAYRRSVDPSSQLEIEAFINTRKRSRAGSTASLNVIAPALPPPASSDQPGTKRKRNKDDRRSSTPAPNTRRPSFSEARRTAAKGYSTLPPDYVPPPQPTFVYSPVSTDTSPGPSLVLSPGVSENSSGAEPISFDTVSPHADTIVRDFGSDLESDSDVVDCGFCSKEPSECVCRAISMDINQLIDSASLTSPSATLLSNPNVASTRILTPAALSTSSISTGTRPSILDNLPPIQPGVPLKPRHSKQSTASASTGLTEGQPIHLTPVPQLVRLQTISEPSSRPVCSGDPSNCAACADDPFGRAFCTALANGDVCRNNNCTSCPKNNRPALPKMILATDDENQDKTAPMDVDAGSGSGVGLGMGMSVETGMLLCCGDPKLCGGGGCGMRTPASPLKAPQPQRPPLRTAGSTSASIDHPESHTRSITDTEDGGVGKNADQDIPTNEAWERLKAHPNVGFADLTLLADVVARRTKCTGPRVLLSPTPEEDTVTRRKEDEGETVKEAMDQDSDENALRLPQTLVPHAALVRCGRDRLMRVQAEGVRDALAMLDVQRPT